MKTKRFAGIDRRQFLRGSMALGAIFPIQAIPAIQPSPSGADDRQYWVEVLAKVAEPVLRSASQRRLKAEMPVEAPHGNAADRRQFTHLEALGRLLSGLAPWLASGPDGGAEGKLRNQYAEPSRKAIQSCSEPPSPDHLNFNQGSQPIVDTAFLALAIVRAP